MTIPDLEPYTDDTPDTIPVATPEPASLSDSDSFAVCKAQLADLVAAVTRHTELLEALTTSVNSIGAMTDANTQQLAQFMVFAQGLQQQISTMDLGTILRSAVFGGKKGGR